VSTQLRKNACTLCSNYVPDVMTNSYTTFTMRGSSCECHKSEKQGGGKDPRESPENTNEIITALLVTCRYLVLRHDKVLRVTVSLTMT
jgi:hypothetical protein